MYSTWTTETMEDAANKCQFIVITSLLDIPRVNITDIQLIWALFPEIVFNSSVRLVGLPEDIANTLRVGGVDEEGIEETLANSVSSQNYNSDLSEAYEAELQQYNGWKQAVIDANVGQPGSSLQELMVLLNPHMVQQQKKAAVVRTRPVTTKTTTAKKST